MRRLMLVVASGALIAMACGGGDKKATATDAPASSETSVATTVARARSTSPPKPSATKASSSLPQAAGTPVGGSASSKSFGTIFSSLFGGAFGYGLHALAPALAPQPELFVLLGMIVMFGSIIKGYWSGLLMIADLSGCYHQLLLPGMIAGGISYVISWELRDQSIFGLTIEPTPQDAEPQG